MNIIKKISVASNMNFRDFVFLLVIFTSMSFFEEIVVLSFVGAYLLIKGELNEPR